VVKTAVKRSLQELEPEVLELIRNEMILRPEAASGTIARDLWEMNTEGLFSELGRVLSWHYVSRIVMAERRKAKPKPEPPPALFPYLKLPVPSRIATPEGKRPLLGKSTATEIRTYVKTLNNRHRDKIAGLQAVLEIMEKYIRTNRGITAAEVAQREADA
jgi:hypothetical protein